MRQYPGEVDLTHVNILAELQMEAGQHPGAAATIRRAAALLCPSGPLPIDLQARALATARNRASGVLPDTSQCHGRLAAAPPPPPPPPGDAAAAALGV